jgi:hypothetical protein
LTVGTTFPPAQGFSHCTLFRLESTSFAKWFMAQPEQMLRATHDTAGV